MAHESERKISSSINKAACDSQMRSIQRDVGMYLIGVGCHAPKFMFGEEISQQLVLHKFFD